MVAGPGSHTVNCKGVSGSRARQSHCKLFIGGMGRMVDLVHSGWEQKEVSIFKTISGKKTEICFECWPLKY